MCLGTCVNVYVGACVCLNAGIRNERAMCGADTDLLAMHFIKTYTFAQYFIL